MKKTTILIAAAALVLAGCGGKPKQVTITNTVELESRTADLSPYKWLEGECADFQEITLAESIRFIEEGGSGILYYGYVGCPFCERALPLLNKAALETGVTVYYVDVKRTDPAPTQEEYEALVQLIESTFDNDSNGKPAFYVPEVIGIKNGEIAGYHVTLVDGWKPADADDQMNDLQKEKLLDIYRDIIYETAD